MLPHTPRKLSLNTPFSQSQVMSLSVPSRSMASLSSSSQYRLKPMPARMLSASGPNVRVA